MLRFYGQPKFKIMNDGMTRVGYELFIRELQDNRWVLPADFTACTPDQLEQLLMQTIAALPAGIELISFNLEQSQFIDDRFIEMVKRVQATTAIKIFTELTERTSPNVSTAQLRAAAAKFHAANLLVCIDDVGTGDNTPDMVIALDEYIDEYKFALQNFRPFNRISEITATINFWYKMAADRGKMLAIEGLENESDYDTIKQYYPCDVIQGYYTGKPELLQVAADMPSNLID